MTLANDAEAIAAAAASREMAALDVYDGLDAKGAGCDGLAQALLQLAETSAATAVQPTWCAGGLASPRKRDLCKQQIIEFLDAKGHKGPPASFAAFVDVYNAYVDHSLGRDEAERVQPPPGESADPRVLSMAHSINARMSQERSTSSPRGERFGGGGGTSGPSSARMTLVSSTAKAPEVPPGLPGEGISPSDGRPKPRASGRRSSAPGMIPSPQDSPEFKRAGTQKFDYSFESDRTRAKEHLSVRRSESGESPGASPHVSRNASLHGGNEFSPRGERKRASSVTTANWPPSGPPSGSLADVLATPAPPEGRDASPRQSQARSSKFRARRLSKDVIYDDETGEDETGSPPFHRSAAPKPSCEPVGATSQQSPEVDGTPSLPGHATPLHRSRQASRDSKESILDASQREALRTAGPAADDKKVLDRRISLDALVAIEQTEAAAGSPNPIDAVARVIDGASLLEAVPTKLSFSEDGGPPKPRSLRVSKEGGMKPSKQQHCRMATRAEEIANDASVTVAREISEDAVNGVSCDPSIVGSFSCHGLEPSDDGSGGEAKINQDCACVGQPFGGLPGTAAFFVYDGHGKYGHEVSHEAMHTIFRMCEEAGQQLIDDPGGTLADAFEACNIHLRMMACEADIEVNALESGSCGVAAFINLRELFVASVGDCRCVLGTTDEDGALANIQLSTDHKCDLPGEQARIECKGGYVRPGSKDPDDSDFVPARMYEDEDQLSRGPGLCVSRALGDLNALRCGLIPTPEVFSHVVSAEDRFIILASDGVWEFLSNDEVVSIIDSFYSKGLPALDACRYLIAKAAIAWRHYEGEYRDDVTAIVVYLDGLIEHLTEEGMQPVEEEGELATPSP